MKYVTTNLSLVQENWGKGVKQLGLHCIQAHVFEMWHNGWPQRISCIGTRGECVDITTVLMSFQCLITIQCLYETHTNIEWWPWCQLDVHASSLSFKAMASGDPSHFWWHWQHPVWCCSPAELSLWWQRDSPFLQYNYNTEASSRPIHSSYPHLQTMAGDMILENACQPEMVFVKQWLLLMTLSKPQSGQSLPRLLPQCSRQRMEWSNMVSCSLLMRHTWLDSYNTVLSEVGNTTKWKR